jgi:hypothetical protein
MERYRLLLQQSITIVSGLKQTFHRGSQPIRAESNKTEVLPHLGLIA